MLRKTRLVIVYCLAVVGFASVSGVVGDCLSIMFPGRNSLESGRFRDLEIGMKRYEVGHIITGDSRLKIIGYSGSDGKVCIIGFDDKNCSNLASSGNYYLRYVAWYEEAVDLSFRDDQLVKIEFSRHLARIDP